MSALIYRLLNKSRDFASNLIPAGDGSRNISVDNYLSNRQHHDIFKSQSVSSETLEIYVPVLWRHVGPL